MKRMLLMALAVSASVSLFANADGASIVKEPVFANQKSQVVSSTISKIAARNVVKLNNGTYIVKDNEGNVCRTVSLDDKKLDLRAASTVSTKSIDVETAALYEGFEGYDGISENWVPTGWSVKKTDGIDAIAYGMGTWHVSGVSTMNEPYEGNYMYGIQFLQPSDIEGTGISQQDEWLISPKFTVQEGQVLEYNLWYSPLFLFDIYEGVDWNTGEWINQEVIATMKVLISTNGGESWDELQDVSDLYMGMSFIELYSYYSSQDWYGFTINLASYVGKEVQIAFEYVGINGDTMFVDAIGVGYLNPEACYLSPVGSLHFGFDELYRSYNNHIMLVPADTDLTWYNTSGPADSFTWTYDDGNNEAATSDEEESLVLNYAPGMYVAPMLTATVGSNDSTYYDSDYLQAGGGPEETFGVGTYNLEQQLYTSIIADDAGNYLFGFSSAGKSVWSDVFSDLGAEDYADLSYIGNFFMYPGQAYKLSRITVFGSGTFSTGATMNMAVISVNEQGVMADTLAVLHCDAEDVIFPYEGDPDNGDLYVMPFDVLIKDDFGLETPGEIDITGNIFLSLSVSNVGQSNFSVFCTAYPDPNENCYGYFGLDLFVGGEASSRLFPMSTFALSTGTMYGSFYFNIDATFPGDPTGIEEMTAGEQSAAKVAVVGGDFVVTAPEGIDAVTVYNVAGQAVAASEVAGTTTVDAQSLAKGVYILRFNDGSTVKVIK